MPVSVCQEAYLITNWLVEHRLSRSLHDTEALLLERTRVEMIELGAPQPLRKPCKYSSLPRSGHWWKDTRMDREAVLIAATERYYQRIYRLPLSENLLIGLYIIITTIIAATTVLR
jgi:hypothetical protein